jgi:nitrite reductase (NADH) small subunit
MTTLSAPVLRSSTDWHDVAALATLTPDRGAAVLVDGVQIALFRLSDGSIHALDNHEPISGANVLSRGIVGDRAGVPVVASPIYKQCYELASGRCLDDDEQSVDVHEVALVDDRIHVRLTTTLAATA